jgi:hypothetical protein
MWMKIVAGVAAALAVVTVGVYVAMPASTGTCGQKCNGSLSPLVEETSTELTTDVGCCGACCSKKATVDVDALAACAGGLSAVSVPSTASAATTKIHCCAE